MLMFDDAVHGGLVGIAGLPRLLFIPQTCSTCI